MRALILALFTAAVPAVAMAQTSPADAVYATEQAFDAYTAIHGIPRGFLTYSAPDAIAFRPKAVRIHEALAAKLPQDSSETPSTLRWRPYAVSVATSGDLAWDYGPWTITGAPDAGWFFTIWQKQADGRWLWLLDTGAGSDDAAHFPAAGAKTIRNVTGQPSSQAGIMAALQLDTDLNGDLKSHDALNAYGPLLFMATVAGEKGAPATTPADKATLLSARPAGQTWTQEGHGASSGGDMVYTYGRVDDAAGTYGGHYVRVWRKLGPKDQTWAIAFDLYQPAK